jgi:hypothetical protein
LGLDPICHGEQGGVIERSTMSELVGQNLVEQNFALDGLGEMPVVSFDGICVIQSLANVLVQQ